MIAGNTFRFGEYEGSPAVFIGLPNNTEAIIDTDDYEAVSRFRWTFFGNGYVYAYKGKKPIYLHWLTKGRVDGMDIDHVNRNPLDNRKSNLRIVPHYVNIRNTNPHKQNTSGYRGVSKHGDKWRAEVRHKGESIRLGIFDDPSKAASAVNAFLDILLELDEKAYREATGRNFSDPGIPIAI